MPESRNTYLRYHESSSPMRTLAGGLVFAVTVALSVALGPVTAANASAGFTTVDELAAEFAAAAGSTGTIITLTQSLDDSDGGGPIAVPASTTLTLDLAGFSLTLVGGPGRPGLGVDAGTGLIIIDTHPSGDPDGILTVTGGPSAAGIGSNGNAGSVTINGGIITATGGPSGAGIGGGNGGAGGTTTINVGLTSSMFER